jgi:hypothetical protein
VFKIEGGFNRDWLKSEDDCIEKNEVFDLKNGLIFKIRSKTGQDIAI